MSFPDLQLIRDKENYRRSKAGSPIANPDDKNKAAETPSLRLTASDTGFVNNDAPAGHVVWHQLSAIAALSLPMAQYPITLSNAASSGYTIITVSGVLTIVGIIAAPNAFTPNGDGINDTGNIKYLNSYLNCTGQVYNRHGENVYSSVGYGIPWDGTYEGLPIPTGTYYYIINLNNGLKTLSGFVAIIR